MKFLLLLASITLSTQSLALNLRGIEYGQSCSEIRQSESLLGSTEVDSVSHDLIFTGQFYDTPAIISYRCADGVLVKQKILMRELSKNKANELFNKISNNFIGTIGMPTHDEHQLEMLAETQGIDVVTNDGNSQFWELKDSEVSLIMYSDKTYSTVSIGQSSKKKLINIIAK